MEEVYGYPGGGSWLWRLPVNGRLLPTRTLPDKVRRAPEVAVENVYVGLPDSDLAARFDKGDGEALNVLCRRHYPTVFRFAYRLTQNLPEAEDCTQEAFARFIRSWSRWNVRSRGAGPWLAAIVKNVVMDHWQKQLKLTKINDPLLAVAASLADVVPPPDSDTLEREYLAAVEEALRGMDSPCRELIEFLFRKGLTQKEAAEQLGDSHDAVKKRYQRCLKRLQADLEEWGVR
jgi:RNA polymerase sigma-70 factor (ECF subfamily)